MKTVFFDVDTQIDFMYPAGSLYVPGAETLVPQLESLTRFAAAHKIPIVSTADAHSEDDPEFKSWPHHCVVGTTGQAKIAATSLNKPLIVETTPGAFESARAKIASAGQIVVEKQQLDAFSNPHLEALLSEIGAERYVVYGVVSELCVMHAVFGLLRTGLPVQLVTDAIKSLQPDAERGMLQQFESAGGTLIDTAGVTR